MRRSRKHPEAPDRLVVYFYPRRAHQGEIKRLEAAAVLLSFVGKIHFKEFRMNVQLLSNATKGMVLAIVETLAATGQVFPSAGPFSVAVTDPTADANGQNGAIVVVPGTPDQKTPTIFRASGNGKTGTVTVKVTDTSNGLSGEASFDVVAPPPPPPAAKPDTLAVSFTPEA
jgi:hypothetical protein